MDNQNKRSVHWADINADKIIREKGEKDLYVCASGITPSGTVHIGNFREIISVDLVVKSLRDKGKNVKFIYSWDDYDVFRKVPANMPEQEKLKEYLRKPITLVPDTRGDWRSYAEANEKELEAILPVVGVVPEYIYQAERYRASEYARGIRTALEKKDLIKKLLDEHRTTPLPGDWMPVSVFSNFTDRDNTKVLSWDGEWGITYRCLDTDKEETIDLRKTSAVKLPWRIDWPMRWKEEEVDFEPAGKDHHSEGGSFDTARRVVEEVFEGEAPVTFQYDFIRIKGRGGKISSSTGEVISLADVLEVYPPEIVRYLFAGTRPNSEFAISFDLDVLKIYEDYDKCERIYFGEQKVNDKKKAKESRIYELSQVSSVPEKMPLQIPFRHLCNLLQIHDGDIDKVIGLLDNVQPEQMGRLKVRTKCAWNWIREFSPEDFRFSLIGSDDKKAELNRVETGAVRLLKDEIENLDSHNDKSLGEAIYLIAEKSSLEAKDLFNLIYRILIGKEKGPRLVGFIMIVGKEKILPILSSYL
ncbi:MAG: lysine--tRNA ligase [Spirochaetales bacterium]|nr:lysine--tRNA ligase [Spirochaetales bacterium]